jgi:hypothetical protein
MNLGKVLFITLLLSAVSPWCLIYEFNHDDNLY